MYAKNATLENLREALDETNKRFQGNLRFKRLDTSSRGVIFTLTVKDSRGPGSRVSVGWGNAGRRISAACWHAHGWFFEELFKIAPEAIIDAAGRKVTAAEGNWVDWNIGPPIAPAYYSNACDCEFSNLPLWHETRGWHTGRSVQG